jgi:MFS family permease
VTDVLTPTAVRRAFLLLSFTRCFPSGLVIGVITLWFLERGLTISQALLAFSLQGIVVFLLELPTSGFADAFGRRPLLVAAGVVNVIASVALILADSFWTFVLAAGLQGVFRALDSGPLEAWYVDTVHATEPGVDVDRALSAQGAVAGGSIALGALLSGGLILWDPLTGHSALLLPLLCWAGLNVVHLFAVVVMMDEPPRDGDAPRRARALASTREAPRVIRDGLGLLRHNRVLLSVVLVEVFMTIGLVVFEIFQPSPACSTASVRSRWAWSRGRQRWSRRTSSPMRSTARAGRCTRRCCTGRRWRATGRRCCRSTRWCSS